MELLAYVGLKDFPYVRFSVLKQRQSQANLNGCSLYGALTTERHLVKAIFSFFFFWKIKKSKGEEGGNEC